MAEEKTKGSQPKINLAVDKPVFSWQSPEFVRYNKDKKWLVYIIMIAITLAVVLGFMHQWSGMALVIVAAIVFVTLSGTHPKTIKAAVYTAGVVVGDKVYDFSQAKSFWISFGDLPKAKIQLAGRFAGQIILPLGEEDPEQIRMFLAKHLPEEEDKGEDLTEMINRILRF
jgi:hypothetical protein